MSITLDNLNDELIKIAQLFGETEKVIKTALQGYLYTQCREQLTKAQQHIDKFEQKYQCAYVEFNQNIQTNESFLQQIQQQNPLWEEDAMEWLYWVEEYQLWEQRQQSISKT